MITRILVPVDGSAGSESAVEAAIEQAKCFEADVQILYVVETPSVFYSPGYSYTTLIAETEQWGKSELEKVEAQCRGAGIACVTTSIEHGHPAQVILEKSVESNADLIVMGTHGRRGLDRVLMGSVASEVVGMSKIPVLTVSLRK